jgi:hypothetical protein
MFREIEKNVKLVKLLIDQYNKELEELNQVMAKSVSEVIKDVR